jgi:hypothetical protein
LVLSVQPLTIDKFNSGLVQYQPNQILADDAFSQCLNAFTYLNTVRRRDAWNLIGRLSRTLTAASLGVTGASPWTFTIYTQLASPNTITGEPNASIDVGSVVINIGSGAEIFTDEGDGTLTSTVGGDRGTINYATGSVTIFTTASPGTSVTISFSYFPSLPGMGVFDQYANLNVISNIFMDTKYTYNYTNGVFNQFPTGVVWNLSDFNLPSPLNYYFDSNNNKLFWITNNQGNSSLSVPIQYSNCRSGAVWYPFSPTIEVPDTGQSAVQRLYQAKFLIPFRGRLYAFNTWEGTTIAGSVNYCNRIRASAATTPFTTASTIVTSPLNPNAWNDTIPGQGYQLDLPTNEEIEGAYSVMNQIIIKTSTKTYVLTHTGMSVAPFKVDLVDDNEGTGSGFSGVNMGSFIQGIGTRSINNTSPTSVQSIDTKVINFIFDISRDNQGLDRVYGIRDYMLRCNSFIFPYQSEGQLPVTYPNRRLIYNYENNTYAVYQDSLTALGYFRESTSVAWDDTTESWEEADFQWYVPTAVEPYTCGVNQQGFVGYLDSGVQQEISLQITDITKQSGNRAAIFTSPSHNIDNLTVADISGIVGDWSYLNGSIGQINPIDANTFTIFSLAYQAVITGASQATQCVLTANNNLPSGIRILIQGVQGMTQLNGVVCKILSATPTTITIDVDSNGFSAYSSGGTISNLSANNQFTVPVIVPSSDMGEYIGGGLIRLRYNFFVMTKAYNHLREGQSIHIPYIDAIVNVKPGVDVQLAAYSSLNTANPTNFPPELPLTDAIFGGYLSLSNPSTYPISQINNRALINQRSNMTSFSFSLDNATMVSDQFFTPFSMSSLTIWKRKAGRPLLPLGGG